MINSFLNTVLPKDEYKRLSALYFFAEVGMLLTIIISLLSTIHFLFFDLTSVIDILLLILLFFVFIYLGSRYLFSGMEYGNVTSRADYKKARKKAVIQALMTGGFFFLFSWIFSGLPTKLEGLFSPFFSSIIFITVFFSFSFFSLKRSYKMNQELEDDESF